MSIIWHTLGLDETHVWRKPLTLQCSYMYITLHIAMWKSPIPCCLPALCIILYHSITLNMVHLIANANVTKSYVSKVRQQDFWIIKYLRCSKWQCWWSPQHTQLGATECSMCKQINANTIWNRKCKVCTVQVTISMTELMGVDDVQVRSPWNHSIVVMHVGWRAAEWCQMLLIPPLRTVQVSKYYWTIVCRYRMQAACSDSLKTSSNICILCVPWWRVAVQG